MSLDVDCAKLLEIKVRANEIWTDPQSQAEYKIPGENAFTILKRKQTAKFAQLEDPKKDNKVRVLWTTQCDPDEPADCSHECEIGGAEIEDNCKDYELTKCLTQGFSVREKIFRTSMWNFEDFVADSLLKNMKILDEKLIKWLIAQLDATCVGENLFPEPFTFTTGDTVIPPTMWTPELFAYLQEVMTLNNMEDAFLLSGRNLHSANVIAAANAANADGKGAQNLLTSIPTFFDIKYMDTELGAKKTFLVRPGAYAFVSKNYYGATPTPIPGKPAMSGRYSIGSKNLPGVTYDVLFDTQCITTSDGDDYKYNWSLRFKGDFFCNPASCDGKQTGVLSFLCGTP